MAWTEPMANGYRGRYRDADNKKQILLNPDGQPWSRKRDALAAARAEESRASRRAAKPNAAKEAASITWDRAWELFNEDRNLVSNTPRIEKSIVENHVRPRWGDKQLNQIKRQGPDGIQVWVKTALRVRKGMSAEYVRRIFGVFRLPIMWAIEEGILDASPCTGVKLPTIPDTPNPYLAVDDSEKLELTPEYRRVVDFGLESGLRPSELSGLHADRIDGNWLNVVDVYVEGLHLIRPWTKNGKTRRVPITPPARKILDEALDGRDPTIGCGIPHFDGRECASVIVFLSPSGVVIRPHTLTAVLRTEAKKAKVRKATGYSVRRGFATRAADAGVDPFATSRIMGHSNLAETQGYVQESPVGVAKFVAALSFTSPDSGAAAGADLPQATLDHAGSDSGDTAVNQA